MFSLMDGYQVYNQINLAKEDQEKITFIVLDELFCYNVMLFSLENVGATYQTLVQNIFKDLIGVIVEVYIVDITVKINKKECNLTHLKQVFDGLNQFNMKYIANKRIYGVTSAKFLGHMITTRGIEADLAKIRTVIDMPPSEAQKLNGMILALNKFFSKCKKKN